MVSMAKLSLPVSRFSLKSITIPKHSSSLLPTSRLSSKSLLISKYSSSLLPVSKSSPRNGDGLFASKGDEHWPFHVPKLCDYEINRIIKVDIALIGYARCFKTWSQVKRNLAEKLREFQNKRGGRVELEPMIKTISEYNYELKEEYGWDKHFDALVFMTSKTEAERYVRALENNVNEAMELVEKSFHERLTKPTRTEFYLEAAVLPAMEVALTIENITNDKFLLHLEKVAEEKGVVELTEFLKAESLLDEEVKLIEKISYCIQRLRRLDSEEKIWLSDVTNPPM